jgi:hypothetical protein
VEIKQKFNNRVAFVLTLATVFLGIACILLEVKTGEHGVILLSLVILGTGLDFSLSIMGNYIKSSRIILFCTKSSFSLLNFGVVFTAMAAAYVIREYSGSSLSAEMVFNAHIFLAVSLLTGVLFFFAKYRETGEDGGASYTLERKDRFTNFAFFVRRIILSCSLIMALIIVFEGLKTDFALWSLLFGGLFIATVPLHILHKHVLSMTVEFLTLLILFYGTCKVYLFN